MRVLQVVQCVLCYACQPQTLGLPDALFMSFVLAWPAGQSSIRTSSLRSLAVVSCIHASSRQSMMSQDCPCELPPLVHSCLKLASVIASLATSSVSSGSICALCTYMSWPQSWSCWTRFQHELLCFLHHAIDLSHPLELPACLVSSAPFLFSS